MGAEFRISLLYFLVSALWIWLSDRLLAIIVPGYDQLTYAQTVKGWAFVIATTVMLYCLLRREFRLRQESRKRLEHSEALFRKLFMVNPLATYIYDRNTLEILDVNNVIVNRYGYARDEFLSMKITDIRPPEDIPTFISRIADGKELDEMYEGRHILKDGQVVDVEVYPYTLEYQGRAAILAVMIDVTERKQLERDLLDKDRLRLALEHEKELLKARERFTAMISHEIRTPLTVISTSVDLLQNYESRMTTEDKRRHFEKIDMQVLRINELLTEALSFWRLENIGLDMQAVKTELNHFIQELVEETQGGAKKSHHFNLSPNSSPLYVNSDPKLLRYAVLNLLQNAVKYSPHGSTVSVQITSESDHALIHVHDEGIGIPEADRERIFEPFYRAGNVGKIQGTGLGLVIARQAIELHQGSLHLHDHGQPGTTFEIRLPVLPA